VGEKSVAAAEVQNEIFCAAAHACEDFSNESAAHSRQRKGRAHSAETADRGDFAAQSGGAKGRGDSFDFGQFRHGSPSLSQYYKDTVSIPAGEIKP
jgi:hypothetical protein